MVRFFTRFVYVFNSFNFILITLPTVAMAAIQDTTVAMAAIQDTTVAMAATQDTTVAMAATQDIAVGRLPLLRRS